MNAVIKQEVYRPWWAFKTTATGKDLVEQRRMIIESRIEWLRFTLLGIKFIKTLGEISGILGKIMKQSGNWMLNDKSLERKEFF